MKKRKWVTSCIIKEIAANVNTLVAISLPSIIIDCIIEKNVTRALSIAVVLSLVYFLSNTIIEVCRIKNEEWFEQKHRERDITESKIIMGMNYQCYEREKTTRIPMISQLSNRDSQRQQIEAIISIISNAFLLIIVLCTYSVTKNRICTLLFIPFILILISEILAKKEEHFINEEFSEKKEKQHRAIWNITSIKYAKEIRAYGLEDYVCGRFDETCKNLYELMEKENERNKRHDWLPSITAGIKIAISYIVAITVFIEERTSIGQFVLILNYSNSFISSVCEIARKSITICSERKYYKQYCELLDVQEEDNIGRKRIDKICTIEFKNVNFVYAQTNKVALDNVNVTLTQGEKVSIVGPNGSGKTTFIKLLMGLYKQTEGEILVNGISLDKIDKTSYLNALSTVFQDYTIFDFDLYENLSMKTHRFWGSQIDRINKVLEKIGLLEKFTGFPNGLYTPVSKRMSPSGIDLSGGEKQLVAIAREKTKNTQWHIFDEPTAQLSPKTEKEILDIFCNDQNNDALIYISHRLSGSKKADRILVFNNGKLVEQGSHAELMQIECGLYRTMFNKQAENYANV